MLQSFLSKNKVSLLANLNTEPLMPSQYQFKKPCCEIFNNKENKCQKSEPQLPKSPTYRRKKIFEVCTSVESQLTAEFKEIDMTESAVQAYKVPVVQQKVEELNLVKKKNKTTKQNGLCLAKGRLELKHQSRPTLSTIDSQREIKLETREEKKGSSSNVPNIKQSHKVRGDIQNEESEGSLQAQEGQPELFTFNSEGTISSFNYSTSKNTFNSKTQSVFRVVSPRNQTETQIRGHF